MKHDWEYKKLGEVAEIIGGSTPKTNVPEYWDGDYFWVTPAELKGDRFIKSTARTITDLAVNSTNLSLLPKGTVLLSSRAPIGKVAITEVPMYCNQGFKNIVCGNKLNNNYVYWLLYGKTEYLNSLGVGATFKEISKKIVENISIPVPPLPTQQAIVSELDTLSGIIAECKETLKDYDALEQSIFYDMFGDPVKNEKGWEVKKLGEMCSKISDGPFGSNLKSEHYVDKGIRVIRLQNIGIGEFINKDKVFISENHYNTLIKYTCNSGDIVVGTLGEPNLRACKIPSTIPISIHKADCVHIVPNTCSILSDYFIALLNIPSFVKNKSNASHGQTRGRISYGQIKEFNIPVPPLSLQQTFASKIEAIEQMKEEMKKALQEAETLYQARMDYWFN